MGFRYLDWSGEFYSPDAPSRSYLGIYRGFFNSVEMDTTFYGTPRRNVVHSWVASTPEAFRISAKTPRAVIHERGLVRALDLMLEFLEAMNELGEKPGVVLLQFPPSFIASEFNILQTFLSELRTYRQAQDIRLAVEFRHASWYTEERAT